MEQIIIDNYDFLNMSAMKYWSHPKTYDAKRKAEEIKIICNSGTVIGSRKMDGAWNMLIKDLEGNYYLRSRTESVNGGYVNKQAWIPHIINELSCVPNGTVLLGEIYFPNDEGSRKVTSVLNCLKDKCLERQKERGYLHFYIFDVLAYNGKSLLNVKIEDRIGHYLDYELFDVLKGDYIETADYLEGEELWHELGKILSNGGEGMVITQKTYPYEPGKRAARKTIKVKKEIEQTLDVFLDGAAKQPTRLYSGKELQTWSFYENIKTGEKFNKPMYSEYCAGAPVEPITKAYYYGWASAVSISVMKDGKPYHIGWISGITDEMKKGIITEPDKYKNKVFEVTAMEVEHINGQYSLRHAKFVQERKDKSYEDCGFEQIAQ
jgi:ATP-dependent DNA ligase